MTTPYNRPFTPDDQIDAREVERLRDRVTQMDQTEVAGAEYYQGSFGRVIVPVGQAAAVPAAAPQLSVIAAITNATPITGIVVNVSVYKARTLAVNPSAPSPKDIYLVDLTGGTSGASGGPNVPVKVGDNYECIFQSTAADGTPIYAGICAYPRLAFSQDGCVCAVSSTLGFVAMPPAGSPSNLFNQTQYNGFFDGPAYPFGQGTNQFPAAAFQGLFHIGMNFWVNRTLTRASPPSMYHLAIILHGEYAPGGDPGGGLSGGRALLAETFPIFGQAIGQGQYCSMHGVAYLTGIPAAPPDGPTRFIELFTNGGLPGGPSDVSFGGGYFWMARVGNNQYMQKIISP